MKKILFCIQWYPAYDSANTFCDEQIIKELVKDKDCEIHCLSYKRPQDKEYEVIENVHIHRFKRSLFWSWYIDQIHNKKKFSVAAEKLNRIFLRFKQFINIPLYPIYEPIQCLRFALHAIRLHRRECFDVVVSEFHGSDSLLAGYLLKFVARSIKFIPIYWDSMVGGYLAKYIPESYARKRRLLAERKVASIADKVIGIKCSRKIYDDLGITLNNFHKYTFLDIPRVDFAKASTPNSLDDDFMNVIEETSVNVIFTGTLGKRSVSYLFSLMNDVEQNINLIMVCSEQYHAELYEISKLHQSLKVKVLDYMPYDRLSQLLHSSDILLNFGNANPYLVPSKIYDYISYAKPIISICNIDDDTSKEVLSKYPVALIIDERESNEKNVECLQQFINSIGSDIDLSTLENLYADATGKAFSDVIRFL